MLERDPNLDTLLAECISVATPLAERQRTLSKLAEDFCAGRQFDLVTFKSDSVAVIKDHWSDSMPRIAVNHVSNNMLTWSSLLTKEEWTALAEPATDDPEDVYRAEVANRFIEFFALEESVQDKTLTTTQNMCKGGTSGFKVWYDPRQDKVRWEKLTVHDFLIDPVEDYKQAQWVVFERYVSLQEAKEAFRLAELPRLPEKAKRKLPSGQEVPGVLAQELWHRPCDEYPEGVYCCWMDGEQVETTIFPNLFVTDSDKEPEAILPIFLTKARNLRDNPYGSTPLWEILPLQRQLNLANAKIARFEAKTTNIHLLLPAKLAESFNVDEDSVIPVTDPEIAKSIQYVAPPQMNPVLLNSRDYYEAQMSAVMGLSAVTTSEDTKARSGRAVERIVEIDKDRNADAFRSMHDMLLNAYKLTLRLVGRYYDTPRQMKITNGTSADVISFSGADIQGVDVRLRLGSEIDQRDDQRVQQAAEGIQAGTATPLDLERAQKRPRYGMSKRLSEQMISDYLRGVEIDVQPDDLNLEVFKEQILKAKSRALAEGRRQDWVALHDLSARIDELMAEADEMTALPEAEPPPTPEDGAPPADGVI